MKYKLETIVFISGAIVMMLEITGSRVLAPYLGTSIFVWTSLIGIVLGSLSLGYFWGGKLADKNPTYQNLSLILIISALLVGLTTFFKEIILNFLYENITDLRTGAVIAATVLFAPVSVLLGMVSPYAIKLKMKDLEKSGSTAGNLYAVSTIGSIVGTFLTGFFLLAYFGNTKLLLILGILLALISLLAYSEKLNKAKIATVILLAFYFGALENIQNVFGKTGNIIDLDTLYNRVWIYEDTDKATGQQILKLGLNKTSSSAMFLESDELVFEYTKFYNLAKHFKPDLKKALMISGGAYSYPKEFLKKFPKANLDVVEIDPALTEIAKKYFHLKESPRLKSYHEDGRTFLNRTENTYDVIFGDAFQAFYAIPHQLTTLEAVEKMSDKLSKNGLVILNIISTIEGDAGKFLQAEYKTFKEVFPQVYIFPVQYPENGQLLQNIILVALKSEKEQAFTDLDPELNQYLKHLWKNEIPQNIPILTDDFAPVDQYVMKLL